MTRFIHLQRGRWLGPRAHPAEPLELSGHLLMPGGMAGLAEPGTWQVLFSNPITISLLTISEQIEDIEKLIIQAA